MTEDARAPLFETLKERHLEVALEEVLGRTSPRRLDLTARPATRPARWLVAAVAAASLLAAAFALLPRGGEEVALPGDERATAEGPVRAPVVGAFRPAANFVFAVRWSVDPTAPPVVVEVAPPGYLLRVRFSHFEEAVPGTVVRFELLSGETVLARAEGELRSLGPWYPFEFAGDDLLRLPDPLAPLVVRGEAVNPPTSLDPARSGSVRPDGRIHRFDHEVRGTEEALEVGGRGLARALERLPDDLGSLRVAHVSGRDLVEIARCVPALHSLDLTHVEWSGADDLDFLADLPALRRLRVLDDFAEPVLAHSPARLLPAIGRLTELEYLTLENLAGSSAAELDPLALMPRLRGLRIEGGSGDLDAFVDRLARTSPIETLEIEGDYGLSAAAVGDLRAARGLRRLELRHPMRTSDEILHALAAIEVPSETLFLGNLASASDEGILALARRTDLQTLHLHDHRRVEPAVIARLQEALPHTSVLAVQKVRRSSDR